MEERKVLNTTYSNQDSNQYGLPWLLATLTRGLTDVLWAGTNETKSALFWINIQLLKLDRHNEREKASRSSTKAIYNYSVLTV
jgi:hypothetical protein